MPVDQHYRVRGSEWSPDVGFSASDCHAYLLFRARPDQLEVEPVEFGEVVTVSISAHRDKFPVARIGEVKPIGFTAGHRTVAGGLVTLFRSESTLRRAVRALFERAGTTGRSPVRPKPDEIPPFDLVLAFVSEMGTAASVVLRGVTILDEGFQISTEQPNPYISLSFLAADYEVRYLDDDESSAHAMASVFSDPSGPQQPARQVVSMLSWQTGRQPPALSVRPLDEELDGSVLSGRAGTESVRPGLYASVPLQPPPDLFARLDSLVSSGSVRLDQIVPQPIRGEPRVVDPWFQGSVAKQFSLAPEPNGSPRDEISEYFSALSRSTLSDAGSRPAPPGRYYTGVLPVPPAERVPSSPIAAPSVNEVAYRFRMDRLPRWNSLSELGTGYNFPINRGWLSDGSQSVSRIQGIEFPTVPTRTQQR